MSIAYSKNSHMTPIVILKQNAITASKMGEALNLSFELRFKMTIIDTPIAAIKKPFTIWSIVSQCGTRR